MNDFEHISPVKYWCYKVLPLVYDESLSYMELLDKVVYKLNEVIKNTNVLPEYITEQIKNYITTGEISKVLYDVLANYTLNVKFPPNGITPAKGDGTTDDTNAFQGCLDYANTHGGMMITVPSGNYLCGNLHMYSNCSIKGEGRYTTKIVVRGGVSNPFIGGELENIQISDIAIDGNADIQVNHVDIISIKVKNALFKNMIITGGYTLMGLTANGGNIQLDNIIYDKAVVRGLDISKAVETSIEASHLVFNTVSKISGESEIRIGTDNGLYSGISCNAEAPVAIEVSGNKNSFICSIENATNNYTDTGVGNTFYINGEKTIPACAIYNGNNFDGVNNLIDSGTNIVILNSNIICDSIYNVKNATIIGRGHTITLSENGRINFLDNISLKELTFTGNTQQAYGVHFGYAMANPNPVSNLKVFGCKFDGLNKGVYGAVNVNASFECCEFTNSSVEGLSFAGDCENVSIRSCYFGNNFSTGLVFSGGIQKNVIVDGCKFYNNGQDTSNYVSREHLNFHGAIGCAVNGCTFDTCNGPSIDFSGHGRSTVGMSECSISNCFIKNQTDSSTPAIVLYTVTNCSVHDNVIYTVKCAVECGTADTVSISNNRVIGTGSLFTAQSAANLKNVKVFGNIVDAAILDLRNIYANWVADNSVITNCTAADNISLAPVGSFRYMVGDAGGKMFDIKGDKIRLFTSSIDKMQLPALDNRTYCKNITVIGYQYTITELAVNTGYDFRDHQVIQLNNPGTKEGRFSVDGDGWAFGVPYVKLTCNVPITIEIEYVEMQ